MFVSDKTYRQIAEIFNGDESNKIYKYKTGEKLVEIFNDYFSFNDAYYNGFPTRWIFAKDQIKNIGLLNFFKIILSSKYLRVEEDFTRENYQHARKEAIMIFNEVLDKDDLKIITIDNSLEIEKIIDGTEIGKGGFATVFNIGNKVLKVLKTELRNDESACHRFKREYEITDSLRNINGIMKVYNFDNENYSYTMEYCDYTLENYLKAFTLDSDQKYFLINRILSIMSEVHDKDVIHRDLTPNNIFIK